MNTHKEEPKKPQPKIEDWGVLIPSRYDGWVQLGVTSYSMELLKELVALGWKKKSELAPLEHKCHLCELEESGECYSHSLLKLSGVPEVAKERSALEPTPPSQIEEERLVNADYLAGYNQARRDMEEYESEGEFSGKWEQWEETTDVIERLLKKVKELEEAINKLTKERRDE